MLTKVLALAKSKVALAVLGVLMVGGSGGAVAAAASQGHFNALGIQLGSSKNEGTETPEGHSDAHAEGMLTACDATAGTISVTTEGGTVYAFNVNSATRFNGETHAGDHSGATGDSSSSPEATASTTSGGTDGTGDRSSTTTTTGSHGSTDAPDGSKDGKGSNGSPSTSSFGLSDLCALVNKDKVQVQATTSTTGSTTTYTAVKITVEGQGEQANGTPEATDAPETQRDFSGSVDSVSATGFTMTANGVQYTVDTTNARFDGGSLTGLAAGAQVQVQGTLSGGTITASGVEVRGSSSGGSSDGSGTGH